jgi:hypothetical protein
VDEGLGVEVADGGDAKGCGGGRCREHGGWFAGGAGVEAGDWSSDARPALRVKPWHPGVWAWGGGR